MKEIPFLDTTGVKFIIKAIKDLKLNLENLIRNIHIPDFGIRYRHDINSIAEGSYTYADGLYSHAEGDNTNAAMKAAHSEGRSTIAAGESAHSEGIYTHAYGTASHSEGTYTNAGIANEYALMNGEVVSIVNLTIDGVFYKYAFTGYLFSGLTDIYTTPRLFDGLVVSDIECVFFNREETDYRDLVCFNSGVELNNGLVYYFSFTAQHVIEYSGNYTHAEGYDAYANGETSHAEGTLTRANGECSHAEGVGTTTTNYAEHAQGKWNESHTDTIHSVGIGDAQERKNAFEIMSDGRIYVVGLGNYYGTNPESALTLQEVIQSLQLPT